MQNHRFVFLLNQAKHRLMSKLNEEALAKWQITAVQLGALFALEKNDGCQLRELAETLGLDNSALTGLTRRMVEAGVMEKRRCTLDNRASRAYLTQRGKQILTEGHEAMKTVNHNLTTGFTPQEIDTAARFLTEVTRRFS